MLKKALMVFVLICAALAILPTTGFCNAITNIVSTPLSPASVNLNEHIEFTFDYETDLPTGVQIFVRVSAVEGGNPSFNSHGSPVYPVGTGSGTGWFYCTSGTTVVTQIRVNMQDPLTSEVLEDLFIDVHFEIGVVGNETTSLSQVKGLYR